jgi:hypothetical protein
MLLIHHDDDIAERVATLESIVDSYGLAETISALAIVCGEKSSHILANWQDESLANSWGAIETKLDRIAADTFKRIGLHK